MFIPIITIGIIPLPQRKSTVCDTDNTYYMFKRSNTIIIYGARRPYYNRPYGNIKSNHFNDITQQVLTDHD